MRRTTTGADYNLNIEKGKGSRKDLFIEEQNSLTSPPPSHMFKDFFHKKVP